MQGELQIADGGGTVESVPRHVGVAVREDEGGGPPQDRILPGAESRCHMAVFSGKRRHPVRHAGGKIVQPVAAFHQQPRHFLTVGRRRRVAGLFQRLEQHAAINGFVFIRAGGAPRLKQHVALQVGKRGILDKRQGRGRDMFQGQGRLGTDGDAVAAPDAAGQSPVQDIHRPVGVASEDALRAYADAAPAPDAMILVEFKRNHRQSFGSVSERTPFPGGFPPFVS